MNAYYPYRGATSPRHTATRLGILLVNLGTPAAPTAAALRPFLRRFLNDPRVIEKRTLSWKFLLNCIIIPLRAPNSAKAYKSIWQDNESPLHTYSQGIAAKLKHSFSQQLPLCVELGMSYSSPDIQTALGKLREQDIGQLVVLPLYPQYSGSTVGSVFDAVTKELSTWRLVPSLRFISSYHDHPAYIKSMAAAISDFRQQQGTAELLLFSFHGMPLTSLLKGDPYHCQCYKSARLIAQALGLADSDYMVTFQSRFGKSKWLQPYTDKTLAALPAQGKKKVQLVCPGFATDCVETLEEILAENQEIFRAAGGKEFGYIPCLNDTKRQVEMLHQIIEGSSQDLKQQLERINHSLPERQEFITQLKQQTEFYVP